jgi:HEAT repeat protein
MVGQILGHDRIESKLMSGKRSTYPALVVAIAAVVVCACRSQESKSTPQLIEDLQMSAHLRTRAAAARILGARKAVQAVPPLITALQEPYPLPVSAARALGTIRDPRAVEPLIRLLMDYNPLVREAAARALGDLKDPRAVAPLIAALKTRNQEAAPALARFGEAAVVPLTDCLRDPEVSIGAASALVSIGKPAVGELIRALGSDADYVRLEAARALSQIDDPRAAEALTSVLGQGDLRLVAAAYRFLLRRADQPGRQNLLRDALHTYGRPEMARDFCRSGNPALRLTAKNWTDENHYSAMIPECDDIARSR